MSPSLESDKTSNKDTAMAWLNGRSNAHENTPIKNTSTELRETMVNNAMLVGSTQPVEEWYDIMQDWRTYGYNITTTTNNNDIHDIPGIDRYPHLNTARHEFKGFYQAYSRVAHLRITTLLLATNHRLRLADMFIYYQKAIKIIDIGRTAGVSPRSSVKTMMFGYAHPEWVNVVSPSSDKVTRSAYRDFEKMLSFGSRWYTIGTKLGFGVLALIPIISIPHTFLQTTLRLGQLDIWIELIQRFNPQAIEMGRLISPTMVLISAGKQLPRRRRLRLETIPRSSISMTDDMTTLFEDIDF